MNSFCKTIVQTRYITPILSNSVNNKSTLISFLQYNQKPETQDGKLYLNETRARVRCECYGCALCNNALLLTTGIIKKQMP